VTSEIASQRARTVRGPNAELKSWKILRKIRSSPSRATTLFKAVQNVFEKIDRRPGKYVFAAGCRASAGDASGDRVDRSPADHGLGHGRVAFVVAGRATVRGQPGEGALDRVGVENCVTASDQRLRRLHSAPSAIGDCKINQDPSRVVPRP
jgi:hypothetical protein